jgi:fructokinase
VAGAVWSDGSRVCSVPAFETHVVDSTGAGDAFAAGFLASADDVERALIRAARLAARAVSRVGARPVPD